MDGILSYGTAALYEPYDLLPPGPLSATQGFLYFESEVLKHYAIALDEAGFQLHFHATGDRGVGLALDAIEAAQIANSTPDRRHRITHLYQVAAKDQPRFKELGVIADFQVSDSNIDPEYIDYMYEVLGARVDEFLPVAAILQAGATVTLSSDWDAESLSPFDSIQNALARDFQAVPDLATAIKMKTTNTAYLLHQDKLTGSLELGKAADLIVIDQNLFEIPVTSINKTKVLLTMLAGEVVYQHPDF